MTSSGGSQSAPGKLLDCGLVDADDVLVLVRPSYDVALCQEYDVSIDVCSAVNVSTSWINARGSVMRIPP